MLLLRITAAHFTLNDLRTAHPPRAASATTSAAPQFGPDQPCSEGMYAAMLREIELASKFSSER